jgi:hypothetical protein
MVSVLMSQGSGCLPRTEIGVGSGGSAGIGGGSAGASGNTDSGGGGEGGDALPSGNACTRAKLAQPGLVTNFEGESATFEGGSYYMYKDEADRGETWPDAGASSTLVPVSNGFEGKGLHLEGDFFRATSWGAGFGIQLECTDIGSVAGIRFWLRSMYAVPIHVGVATVETQSTEFGGNCTDMPCIAHQVTVFPPAAPDQFEWREMTVLFDDLTAADALDSSQVIGINFAGVPLDDGWAFDIWVDELRWIGEDEAAAGAGGQSSGGAAGLGGTPG